MTMEAADELYEPQTEQHDGLQLAQAHWLDLAHDLVHQAGSPTGNANQVAVYRLYVIGVLAVVEADQEAGASGLWHELLNERFYEGLARAAERTPDSVSPYVGQELTRRQWDELLTHQIGPSLQPRSRRTEIPHNYRQLLQLIARNEIVLRLN